MARPIAEGVLVEVDAAAQPALSAARNACSAALGPLFWGDTADGSFAEWQSDDALVSQTGLVRQRGGPLSKTSLIVLELISTTGSASSIYIRAADVSMANVLLGGRSRNRAGLDAILQHIDCRIIERT